MPSAPASLGTAACVLAIANLLAASLFVGLLTIAPTLADLNARIRFRQLDDAGVINAPALASFHPQYQFGNGSDFVYRSTVPAFLTEPARDQAATNSTLGLIFTLANAAFWFAAWWSLRLTKLSPTTPS